MPKWGNDVPCNCAACNGQRFGVPKYGREHAAGCVCPSCIGSYEEHNKRLTCPCSDCESHRGALYGKKPKRVTTRERSKVATVNFCERCNTMGKSSAMGSLQFWTNPNTRAGEPMELCPGCIGDLLKWLKAESIGDRPKSYVGPYAEPKSDPLAGLSTSELAAAFLARQATESAKELGT